jgi:hypothetical protein
MFYCGASEALNQCKVSGEIHQFVGPKMRVPVDRRADQAADRMRPGDSNPASAHGSVTEMNLKQGRYHSDRFSLQTVANSGTAKKDGSD